MSRRVLLVRHPPVADALRGVCYGASDVPLAAGWEAELDALARELLAAGPVAHLFHSDLTRCAAVAAALAARLGAPPTADRRLRERDFGAWELRRWDDIYAETGDAMMGTVTDPAGWRPPGGETTFELRARALAWCADLPPVGTVVAVTHGGPIAVLRGSRLGLPVARWPELVPQCGRTVELT